MIQYGRIIIFSLRAFFFTFTWQLHDCKILSSKIKEKKTFFFSKSGKGGKFVLECNIVVKLLEILRLEFGVFEKKRFLKILRLLKEP